MRTTKPCGKRHAYCGKCRPDVMTLERRTRISAARMGQRPSDETRAKMSAAHKGSKRTLEQRARMGAAQRNRLLIRVRHGYFQVKLFGTWVKRANFLWIAVFGPLVRGHVVHHQDTDPLNDWLENLLGVSQSEHVKIHRLNALGNLAQYGIPL